MATPSTLSRRALAPNFRNLRRARPLLPNPPTRGSPIASLKKSGSLPKSRQSFPKRIHIPEKSSIRSKNYLNPTSTFNRKKNCNAKSKDRLNFLTVQHNGFLSKLFTKSKSSTSLSFSLAKDIKHLSFIRLTATLWLRPIATIQRDIYRLSPVEEFSKEMSAAFSKSINSFCRKESSTTALDPMATMILNLCP